MKSKNFENVNLYDAESESEADSGYDVVNLPGTPTSSRGEVKEKVTYEYVASNPCEEKKKKLAVSFAAKVQEDEKETSKFVRAKPLTKEEKDNIFFAPNLGPTSFLRAISTGNATLKEYLGKRPYEVVVGDIECMFEYFCQETDKHHKEVANLESRLGGATTQRDLNFSKYRGEVMNNERKDEQTKKLQEEIKKLEAKLDAFTNTPEQVEQRSFESAQTQEIKALLKEIEVLKQTSWTKRQESDSHVRNANYRCETAERKIRRIQEEHKDFVKKLGEAHASVTSSLLLQVGDVEMKLKDMTRQYESMEMRGTTAFNMRLSAEKLLKEEKQRVVRLQELLKTEKDIVRSLRHDLVDADMAASDMEIRMHAAERIVRNVNGQLAEVDEKLRIAEEAKRALEEKLEEVKAISLEMGGMIRGNREAEEGEDGATVEVAEVDEEQEGELAEPELFATTSHTTIIF